MTFEEQLLVMGSRLSCPDVKEFRRLGARPGLDWNWIVDAAAWHRTSGVLLANLGAAGMLGSLAAPLADRLRAEYFETVARNLGRGAELERILVAMNRARIDVVLLKGAALIPGIYADCGLRPMSDLDLLVHPNDIRAADALVRSLGYLSPLDSAPLEHRVHYFTDHHHWPVLVNGDGTVAVELHYRLGRIGGLLVHDLDRLWKRAELVTRGAAVCQVPAPEDLLVHACLHFLRDRGNRSRGALGQLCDVDAIIDHARSSLDWDALASETVEQGIEMPLALVLSVATELFRTRAPSKVLAAWALCPIEGLSVETFLVHRVLRPPAWVALEKMGSHRSVMRQLLPRRPTYLWKNAPRGAQRLVEFARSYGLWAWALTRISAHPGLIRSERHVSRALAAMATPGTATALNAI